MAPSYIKSPSKHGPADEVNSVYENSPIPSTYINSPSKVSSADEVNSVYENSPIRSKKIHNKQQQQSKIPKKQMDASVWLKKSQPKVVRSTGGTSSSTAKAYGNSSSNRSLASSASNTSSKMKGRVGSSNKSGRRNSLSTPNSRSKGQPMALAVQREKQQRHKVNADVVWVLLRERPA